MPRSQRHMIEHRDIYPTDSAGNRRPRLLTSITNRNTNTTATIDVSSNFQAYPGVTYSASGLPTGKTISATTGVISGTSSTGVFASCRVTARNNHGSQVSNTFSWTVA
jgi:hypothetical protein